MGRDKMHVDEVETDAGLVARLLSDQFPAWADLPITSVDSFGTDHDIYRLGDRLAVRLPRIHWAVGQGAREATWLPKLAPHLPLAVPTPIALGRPACGYPYQWSVCGWLPGHDATRPIGDLEPVAVDLARFVQALGTIELAGAHPRHPNARGGRLDEWDEQVRHSVDQLGDRVDGAAALGAWRQSVDAAGYTGAGVWIHSDLLPGNLLVSDGRLSGVIDWGGLNVGDPACDLLPAWNLFSGASRNRYREELAVDDDAWLRGRGWALIQAVSALPYYWDSNPGMVRQASHALRQVLADLTS